MTEYFYRVKHTATDEHKHVLYVKNFDFREEELKNFFKAKDEALAFHSTMDKVGPTLNEIEFQGLLPRFDFVDQKIFLVENSDGVEKEHHLWNEVPASLDYEKKICQLKRKEIISKIESTLGDYQNMKHSDSRWLAVPLSYHIVKVSVHFSSRTFNYEDLMEIKHHDYALSRDAAEKEYKKIVKDPANSYDALGIANWDEDRGVGDIFELRLSYPGQEEAQTLYTTFIPLEPRGLRTRKREKIFFEHYGFTYSTNLDKKMPWL